jgi:hypothetical protein
MEMMQNVVGDMCGFQSQPNSLAAVQDLGHFSWSIIPNFQIGKVFLPRTIHARFVTSLENFLEA